MVMIQINIKATQEIDVTVRTNVRPAQDILIRVQTIGRIILWNVVFIQEIRNSKQENKLCKN